MKCLSGKVSSVGIFFAAAALLIVYLLSIRWQIWMPITVFWIAITTMVSTIVYQSLQNKLSSDFIKVVLIEIAVTSLAFHLIYQIPYYGLRGSDIYMDMASTKGIMSSGFVMGDPSYINGTSYFPMIHVFGSEISLITGIDLFDISKWLPSFLAIVMIPLLYLFIRKIFGKESIALLSVLLFATLQHHILFGSLFIRETIALILMVCCLYLYFSAKQSGHPAIYRTLAIVCLIGTTLAHHLTSFMLLAFVSIHFIVTRFSEMPMFRRTWFRDSIAGERISVWFLLLAIVFPFSYWMFVAEGPLYTLSTFVTQLFIPSQWGVNAYAEIAGISVFSVETIRGQIMLYGFYLFLLVFGLTLLVGLLSRLRKYRVEGLSQTLFLFFCGLGGVAALYIMPLGVGPFPDRFLMFGWLFGFAPLVAITIDHKKRWLKGMAVFLLVVFMLFNVYMIEPTTWDVTAEGVPNATSKEDYALANTIDFSNGQIATNTYVRYAIYEVHNNLGVDVSQVINFSDYDWVILHAEVPLDVEWIGSEDFTDRNIIYASDNLSVFRLRE